MRPRAQAKKNAKSILASLRISVANALTKSLPDDDRAKLLERMNVPTTVAEDESEVVDDDDEKEEEEDIRGSVTEEIAAAKAEQARRDEEMWLLKRKHSPNKWKMPQMHESRTNWRFKRNDFSTK